MNYLAFFANVSYIVFRSCKLIDYSMGFLSFKGDKVENWFRCPKCNKPLLKITEKSIVRNEIYCRCCKTSFDVDIEGLKINKAEKKEKTA